mmetsp:Transcript_34682/g.95579  ORF Transcript_34682/g.95579 Transcript_34682/m.95579 type:complete len:593 (-) Transcript_34682:35-1813(-)
MGNARSEYSAAEPESARPVVGKPKGPPSPPRASGGAAPSSGSGGLPRAHPVDAKDIAWIDANGDGTNGASDGASGSWAPAGPTAASASSGASGSWAPGVSDSNRGARHPSRQTSQPPLQSSTAWGTMATNSTGPTAGGATCMMAMGLTPPCLNQPSLALPMVHQQVEHQQRLSTGDTQMELHKKLSQLSTVAQQVQAAELELRHLRQHGLNTMPMGSQQMMEAQQAFARIDQARQLAASAAPELEKLREKIGKTLQVAVKLNEWFVENASKMNISDPEATPSAVLERLLESCESRAAVLGGHVTKLSEPGTSRDRPAEMFAPLQTTPQPTSQPTSQQASQHTSQQTSQLPSQLPSQQQQQQPWAAATLASPGLAHTAPSAPLVCPQGHALVRFATEGEEWTCNTCSQRQQHAAIMFGCRRCDFDKCARCAQQSLAVMGSQQAALLQPGPAPQLQPAMGFQQAAPLALGAAPQAQAQSAECSQQAAPPRAAPQPQSATGFLQAAPQEHQPQSLPQPNPQYQQPQPQQQLQQQLQSQTQQASSLQVPAAVAPAIVGATLPDSRGGPGVSPEARKPGGSGVRGLWVRDPDAPSPS